MTRADANGDGETSVAPLVFISALMLLLLWIVVLFMGSLAVGGLWFFGADGGILPHDFAAYYRVAPDFALRGEAARAYDWQRFAAAVTALTGAAEGHWIGWLNPPSYFLIVAPFGLLPYTVAWFSWIGLSGTIFALGMRVALPLRGIAIVGFAAPAVLACVIKGQNGMLTAGLLALGLGAVERHQGRAGILIGLLSYKPHLGLVLPLLLAAGRRWRAIAAAMCTVLALFAISSLLFGFESWVHFFDSLNGTRERFLGSEAPALPAIQSFYAFGMLATGNRAVALTLHCSVAVVACGIAVAVWRTQRDVGTKAAAAIAACYLATPYVFDHDAVMLAPAAAFLARPGAARWEVTVACFAAMLPAGALFGSGNLYCPAAALILLALAARRGWQDQRMMRE